MSYLGFLRDIVVATVSATDDNKQVIPYLKSPAISYDGQQIAFSYTGDLWLVSPDGGEARMLTSHSGYDDRPRFSPDGTKLAFMSKRTGNGDIYVMSLETEDVKRITYHDGINVLDCWSPDGEWIYFNSGMDGIGNAVYKVRAEGGTPIRIAGDPFESYYNLAISPNGKTLAFNNNGDQWWRRGPNPSGASNIWLVSEPIGSKDYRKITDYSGRNLYPLWDAKGKGLYFVSDRDGNENLWYQDVKTAKTKQITHFNDGRVIRASISFNGKWIVLERDFAIWKLDLTTGETAIVPITVRADKKINTINHRVFNGEVQEFALSPDAKKALFVNRGKIFVTSADKGTEKGRVSFRLTNIQSHDGQISWSPDSKKAIYVSDHTGENQIYLYDFQEKKETQLTDSSIPAYMPKFSPDGEWIAYYNGREEIGLINAETKEVKPFISRIFEWGLTAPSSYAWSPDSKWIAFMNKDENYFENLYVQNIEETTPKQVSFLSHIDGGNILWSADGNYIIFNTAQFRTEWQIARVDLQPVKPEFREDELDKLFEEEKKKENEDKKEEKKEDNQEEKKDTETNNEKKKEPEPVNIEFDGIRNRLRLLTSPQMNCHAMCLSPDSKMMVFYWPMTGNYNLWNICFDEDRKDDPPKQLTSNNGGKWNVYFVPDSKKIYYVDNGKIHQLKIAENGGRDGDPKALDTRAEMDVDIDSEKLQMFNEAWRLIRDNFYDPRLHGADWETVHNKLLPVLRGIQAQEDFHELLNLMVGELKASHLGAGGGGGGMDDSYLGLDFDLKKLERTGKFKVTSILPYGPAALAKEPINVGDYILAIDGVELNGSIDLFELMKHKIRKRTELTVNSKPDNEGSRTVIVQPIDHGTMCNLRYKNWVRENEKYVHEKSSGRLGYVHINAMSYEAYMQLLVDLDTETHNKEGVVVDVRFNGGGFIATFILDVLRKRTYIQSVYKDKPPTSATNLAGNRIFEKPTILVQNEHSGSNTEMFSEDYRRLGLGKVVGTPTAGAVIWTTNVNLLDGTWFRVPFIKVANVDGENLELGSRTVDVFIERTLGESADNKDSQLDIAIEELLNQIDGR